MKLSPAQLAAMRFLGTKQYNSVKYQKIGWYRYRFESVSVRTMEALVRRSLAVIYAPHGTWAAAWLTDEGREFLKGLSK